MGRPQVSFTKRQREQAKRERQQLKAEKRVQRKTEGPSTESEFEEQQIVGLPTDLTPSS